METNQPNQTPTTPNIQPTDSPPNTQTPPISTPKTNKPWLLISLVFLLLSSTGVLGYKYYELKQQLDNQQSAPLASPQALSSPSPIVSPATVDPIPDWKVYTNTRFDYSFQYPAEYVVGQNGVNSPTPETISHILVYNFNATNFPDEPRISVSVTDADQETLKEKAQNHLEKLSTFDVTPNPNFPSYESNQIVSGISQTVFQNRKAFSYKLKGSYVEDGAAEGISPPRERTYYWIENGDTVFLVRVDNANPADKIFASFQFID